MATYNADNRGTRGPETPDDFTFGELRQPIIAHVSQSIGDGLDGYAYCYLPELNTVTDTVTWRLYYSTGGDNTETWTELTQASFTSSWDRSPEMPKFGLWGTRTEHTAVTDRTFLLFVYQQTDGTGGRWRARFIRLSVINDSTPELSGPIDFQSQISESYNWCDAAIRPLNRIAGVGAYTGRVWQVEALISYTGDNLTGTPRSGTARLWAGDNGGSLDTLVSGSVDVDGQHTPPIGVEFLQTVDHRQDYENIVGNDRTRHPYIEVYGVNHGDNRLDNARLYIRRWNPTNVTDTEGSDYTQVWSRFVTSAVSDAGFGRAFNFNTQFWLPKADRTIFYLMYAATRYGNSYGRRQEFRIEKRRLSDGALLSTVYSASTDTSVDNPDLMWTPTRILLSQDTIYAGLRVEDHGTFRVTDRLILRADGTTKYINSNDYFSGGERGTSAQDSVSYTQEHTTQSFHALLPSTKYMPTEFPADFNQAWGPSMALLELAEGTLGADTEAIRLLSYGTASAADAEASGSLTASAIIKTIVNGTVPGQNARAVGATAATGTVTPFIFGDATLGATAAATAVGATRVFADVTMGATAGAQARTELPTKDVFEASTFTQPWTPPDGATTAVVEVKGGTGASRPGSIGADGGLIRVVVPIQPTTYEARASRASSGRVVHGFEAGDGGLAFGGGNDGGAGGGWSDFREAGALDSQTIAMAGGGGGAGGIGGGHGGFGGADIGQKGDDHGSGDNGGGSGGTQVSAGSGGTADVGENAGISGSGENGGNGAAGTATVPGGGGGGGGGWYGGGGGASGSGGGGGSNYHDPAKSTLIHSLRGTSTGRVHDFPLTHGGGLNEGMVVVWTFAPTSATAPATGGISVTGAPRQLGDSNSSATGGLTCDATVLVDADSTSEAVGTQAATGTRVVVGTATLAGAATLPPVEGVVNIVKADATLPATAAQTAVPLVTYELDPLVYSATASTAPVIAKQTFFAEPTLSAAGTTAATADVDHFGDATLPAVGAQVQLARIIVDGEAVTGAIVGAQTADAKVTSVANLVVGATGATAATAEATAFGRTASFANGQVAATGLVVDLGISATLAQGTVLVADPTVVKLAPTIPDMDAVGTQVAAGLQTVLADETYAATAAQVATAELTIPATATASGVAGIVAVPDLSAFTFAYGGTTATADVRHFGNLAAVADAATTAVPLVTVLGALTLDAEFAALSIPSRVKHFGAATLGSTAAQTCDGFPRTVAEVDAGSVATLVPVQSRVLKLAGTLALSAEAGLQGDLSPVNFDVIPTDVSAGVTIGATAQAGVYDEPSKVWVFGDVALEE